jgi:hypothetical protein
MNAPGGSRKLAARHFTTPDESAMHNQGTDSARTEVEVILYHLSPGSISIGDDGHVWKHGRLVSGVLLPYPEPRRIDLKNELGYYAVKLTASRGKRISTSAHRIQWVKHYGPIPDGLEVNHKDLNKENNRIGNLELLTHAKNLTHAWADESIRASYATRDLAGDNNGRAKLTWLRVRDIRRRYANGERICDLAIEHGVTDGAIAAVVELRTWKPERDPEQGT